jgi:response regulator of citrate/malate metabolism
MSIPNIVIVTGKKRFHKDRKVKRGIDYSKVGKIWAVLAKSEDWLHVSAIAKYSGLHESTVRYYLNNYFKFFIDEQRIAETIKIRLVRLKENTTFESLISYLRNIEKVKRSK